MADNKENLVSFTELTAEKQREIASQGGKASVEARRKKKAMREQMEMLLSLPLKDTKVKAKFKQLGIDTDDMDNQMALVFATYQKALKGDTSAINIVREMVGERVQEISINTTVDDKVKELQKMLDKEE